MFTIEFGKKYEVWFEGKKTIYVCRQDPDGEHAYLFFDGVPDRINPIPPLLIKPVKEPDASISNSI